MIVAGAIEVELANSRDLSVCRWDTSPMRQHLLLSLEAEKMITQ